MSYLPLGTTIPLIIIFILICITAYIFLAKLSDFQKSILEKIENWDSQLKEVESQLRMMIEGNQEKNSTTIASLAKNQQKLEVLISGSMGRLEKIIAENSVLIVEESEKEQTLINKAFDDMQQQNISGLESILSAIKAFDVALEKNSKETIQSIENGTLHLHTKFDQLRTINYVDLTNAFQNGVLEDDHFIREAEKCRVTRITDKMTGDLTQVTYTEHGEKNETNTFDQNGHLKYKMQFLSGHLFKGYEYDMDGRIVFEYDYDEAEEVSRKIEYQYDEHGNQTDKIETAF